jgi:uncharacterized protein YciI
MSVFVVTREAGSGWAPGGVFDQQAVDSHSAYMKALADQGTLLLAGPLADTETGRVRVLLVSDARNVDEIERRLADDPWTIGGQLRVTRIEPWNLLVGGELTRGPGGLPAPAVPSSAPGGAALAGSPR